MTVGRTSRTVWPAAEPMTSAPLTSLNPERNTNPERLET